MPSRRRATKSPLAKFIETADALVEIYRRQEQYRGYEYGPGEEVLKVLELRDLEKGVELRSKIVIRATAAAKQLGPYGLDPRAVLNFAVTVENPERAWEACQQWEALKVDLLTAQIRLDHSEGDRAATSPGTVEPLNTSDGGKANLNSAIQASIDLTGYIGPFEKKAIAQSMGLTIPKLKSYASRTPGFLRQVASNRQQWHVLESGLTPSARAKLLAHPVARRRRTQKSGDNSR